MPDSPTATADVFDPWAIKTGRRVQPVAEPADSGTTFDALRGMLDEDPQPGRRVQKAPLQRPHLYFIQCEEGGAIKIGIAQDVPARLVTLQSGCPFRLRLLAVVEHGWQMERDLHRRFAEHRTSGEWFRPAPELLALVEQHRLVRINP